MSKRRRIESVGWVFWLVVSALITPPVTYFVYRSLYETITVPQRIGSGIVISLVLGAILTTVVNEVLQRGVRRRTEEQKRSERREQKRKTRGKRR